jgi:hypothetical protein
MMLKRVLAGGILVVLLWSGFALADGRDPSRGNAEGVPGTSVVIVTVER